MTNTGHYTTACTRRNLIDCHECGKEIEDHELKRTVHWGFWDHDQQMIEGGSRQEHYCQECWCEEFKRDAAAYYEVTDSERFWSILQAADGDLVADLVSMFAGGRPWIRVVDGSLQAINSTVVDSHESDGQQVIEHGTKPIDVDREWFDDVFGDVSDSDRDGRPTIALLKPAEETPFQDHEELPEDQQTIDEADS